MMMLRCYLLVVAVFIVTLVQDVDGTTLIRSHYNNNGGRIVKGERTSTRDHHHQQQRQLQVAEPSTKKTHTNILSTLDQVYNDASSVGTKVKIQTKCKKPKNKKNGDAGVTGDGVGIGKGNGKGGSGKGSGKGSGGGGSGVAGSVTSNTTTDSTSTTTETASNVTDAPSVTTTTGTANSNSTNTTRSLQTNATNSDVFGNRTSSSTNATTTSSSSSNTTSTTVTTDNTPNSTFVVTVGSGAKKGKKGPASSKKSTTKVSADDIPYCEDEEGEGVEGNAPSTPIRSPVASPAAAVGSPSVPSTVQSPAVSSPIVSIPVTMPSNAGVVADATVCEAYRLGVAPTDAPSQNHTTFITMNVDVGADINSIYSQIGTVLREKIGPLLLDCVSERRLRLRRKNQENATELVNVEFTTPTFSGATCTETPENATCIPSMFVSEVYYNGEDPIAFDEKIRQAMLFSDFDIPGLQGFSDVDVSAADSVEEIEPEPDSAPVSAPESAPGSTPGSEPTDRGVPTTTSNIEATQRSRNGPSPGVSVAVAVSVVALVLAALFVVRRHREAQSSDSLSKHIEFTDDFPEDAGAETADDNSVNSPMPSPPQKSYIVSDQSFDESWNSAARRDATEGQEVFATSISGTSRQRNYPQTTFVEADGPDPRLMNLPPRFYDASDTVNL